MIVYIVPQFRSLLDYLGGKLPWQTELMISISDIATRHPLDRCGSLWRRAFTRCWRLPAFVKNNAWTHRLVIRIPGFGRYLLAGIRTNFVAAFAQLKKNKMTNPSALMLLKDISWYFPYRTAIARAHMGLKSGESLAKSWQPSQILLASEISNIFDSLKKQDQTSNSWSAWRS